MSKRRLTTTTEDDLISEIFETKVQIAYGVAIGPLALCFIFAFPSYLSAFKRNLTEHGASPLLPLITFSYRWIKRIYPIFIVFGSISTALFVFPKYLKAGEFIINATSGYALAIVWNASMYQLVIAILSIHRFINSRQPIELKSNLTRKHVIILMVIVILVVIMKDMALLFWMISVILIEQYQMLDRILLYYIATYITYQVFLFIGMAFQIKMKSDTETSHSENCIARHTIIIGSVKLVLLLITGVCVLTGIGSTIAETVLFTIDFFLVPVVIQITEIRHNPNVIKACQIKTEQSKF